MCIKTIGTSYLAAISIFLNSFPPPEISLIILKPFFKQNSITFFLYESIDKHFDCVIICAAITNIAECEENPNLCKKINLINTIRLIDNVIANDSFVIFLSSSAVFDGTQSFYKHTDETNPISEYGKCKNFVEEHIKKNNVNILVAVPSTIQRIKLYYGNNKINHPFKVLIMTGEPFYLNILKYLFNNFNTKKIFNCYGGTEMGNWIYFHDCKKSDLIKFRNYNLVPIGKNFNTVESKIVNGELIAKGPMITLGYINKELNNGKFVFNGEKSSFYTGDLVEKKYGKLICKGRKDYLVKIRGYRIEIPFVEAKLRAIKIIEQCIVVQKKTRNYDNYLVAIVKPINKKISELNLKKAALKELPQYMIPSKFILIKDIPLNANGKIDRKKIMQRYF